MTLYRQVNGDAIILWHNFHAILPWNVTSASYPFEPLIPLAPLVPLNPLAFLQVN